jgi:large subunit ribosomal protein L24
MTLGRTYLKADDQVEVIAGKDKGRVGKVLKVFPAESKATVERINMIKRHTKPRDASQQGQIVEREAPIHVSNLLLICPECAQTGRIGRKVLEDGTKVRFCKKCSESIESK